MPFVGTLTIYNNSHKMQILQGGIMFELIIIITFELWCVFGFLLLENTGWNFKRFVVRKIKG